MMLIKLCLYFVALVICLPGVPVAGQPPVLPQSTTPAVTEDVEMFFNWPELNGFSASTVAPLSTPDLESLWQLVNSLDPEVVAMLNAAWEIALNGGSVLGTADTTPDSDPEPTPTSGDTSESDDLGIILGCTFAALAVLGAIGAGIFWWYTNSYGSDFKRNKIDSESSHYDSSFSEKQSLSDTKDDLHSLVKNVTSEDRFKSPMTQDMSAIDVQLKGPMVDPWLK